MHLCVTFEWHLTWKYVQKRWEFNISIDLEKIDEEKHWIECWGFKKTDTDISDEQKGAFLFIQGGGSVNLTKLLFIWCMINWFSNFVSTVT